jgi:acyl carrier protein phosphodiesterase
LQWKEELKWKMRMTRLIELLKDNIPKSTARMTKQMSIKLSEKHVLRLAAGISLDVSQVLFDEGMGSHWGRMRDQELYSPGINI